MNNPYYNSEGYADPTAYEGIKNASKRWRVWGYERQGKGKFPEKLPELIISASSFDEAIKRAREKNQNYTTAVRL